MFYICSIAECNNALIYPSLGFRAILSKSRRMTDTILLTGTRRLAALFPAITSARVSYDYGKKHAYASEALLPDFDDARE